MAYDNSTRPDNLTVRCLNLSSLTPVVTAGAYSAGNCVGGLLTYTLVFRSSAGGYGPITLQDLVVLDKGNQKAALTILFFESNPIVGTFTDKSNTVLSTDLSKVIGQVLVAQADYTTTDTKGIANKTGLGLILKNAENTQSLYVVITTTGTPTYATTSDITLKLKYTQD